MEAQAKQADSKQQYVIPLTESKAKDWVKALPLTDVGETTRRLYHGLVDLNRRALPPLTRIRISELLSPAVEMMSAHLQRRLGYRAFPLPPKGLKIFNLNQALLLEFAGSYQLATVDMLTRHEVNKRFMQLAVYRALDYMGQALMSSYSVYARTRETIWSDIHQLYLAASENELEQLAFQDKRHNINTTIDERYIEINALALMKPYSLRQEEVNKVDRFIAAHLDQLYVGREPRGALSDFVHVAVLNNDEAAVLMPYSDLPHSPTIRVFDLKPLVEHLETFVRTNDANPIAAVMAENGLNRNLAQRLIAHLTTIRNRSFNRFPKKEKIMLVAQLPNILQAIQTQDMTGNVDQMREEDVLFNSMLFGNDVVMSEGSNHHQAQDAIADPDIDLNVWEVMNSSVGGYGLRWGSQEASGARVGELVGLRDLTQDDNPWMVGAIKWMESTQDTPLRCGIELLSSKVVPLRVLQLVERKISQPLPIEGLLLPSIEGIRPDPVVILPAYIFQPNDEVVVRMGDQEERIRLTMLDECLGSFAHFRFSYESEEPKQESADDFESIWDDL